MEAVVTAPDGKEITWFSLHQRGERREESKFVLNLG